ncbi:FA32A-like protein, partial [Mya arenaria]
MSDYDNVCRGSLKLKGVSDHKIKKKKKKRDKIDKEVAQYLENIEAEASGSGEQKKREDRRTKAEIAFEKRKEKKEFNHHLDSLTEHFDIPK